MRLINLTCPNCGSKLQIDLDNKQATCQYCGNTLLIDDGVQHIQYDNAEKAGYEFEKGRQRAQAEQAKRQAAQMNTAKYWHQNNRKKKKNNTVWWVLGWIFFFPIPLTIVLVRNKTIEPKIKTGIIAGMWIILLIIGMLNNSSNESGSSTVSTDDTVTEVTTEEVDSIQNSTNTSTEEIESDLSHDETHIDEDSITDSNLELIYDKDEGVNYYINKYNKANPENKITSEDIFVYHHHGKDHDNQVKYYHDGFEIVITGGAQVYIGSSKGKKDKITDEDFKEMFKRFVRGFESNISDEQLEVDWKTLLEDNTHYVEFNGYKCNLSMFRDRVEYMTITNK